MDCLLSVQHICFFFSESILEISSSKYHWGCPKSLSIPCPVNVSSDGSNPLHVAVSICRPHIKRLVFVESLGITVCKEALTPYQHASLYTPLSGCLKKEENITGGNVLDFFPFVMWMCDVTDALLLFFLLISIFCSHSSLEMLKFNRKFPTDVTSTTQCFKFCSSTIFCIFWVNGNWYFVLLLPQTWSTHINMYQF